MILTSANSIHQLHEITTHQQSAINSIQTTLTIQQSDITDIKTSINHIINSLSELATKLDIQITLPPPLPLFSTPPTPLPATIAAAAAAFHSIAPPTPPLVAAASSITPSSPTPSFHQTWAAPSPCAILESFSSILIDIPDTFVPSITNPETTLSWFTPNVQPFVLKTEVIAITVDNQTLADNITCLFLLSSVECKRKTCESKVFVFDPGGALECSKIIWGGARFTTYDLEDKVNFKGTVMIRISDPNAPSPRHSRTIQKQMQLAKQMNKSTWTKAFSLAVKAFLL